MNSLAPLLTTVLMVAAAFIAWTVSRHQERQRQELKLSALETKFHTAQARANQLNEQLMKTQHDVHTLNHALEKERKEKVQLTAEYARPFRRQNLILAGIPMFLGLTFGILISDYRSENAYLKAITDFKITAKVAEARAVLFEERLTRASSELDQLRQRFQDETEARIIAETKLELITGETPKLRNDFNPALYSVTKETGAKNAAPRALAMTSATA